VLHRDDAYHGPHVQRAPDFTIRWVIDGRPFRGFACDTATGRERMLEIAGRPPFQPGGHHPEGMFLAAGPNVAEGTLKGNLEDVTPTILTLLGVPAPIDLDGVPLPVLKDVRAETSGERTAVSGTEASSGYSPEEEESIRQRLEDLGYI
jgi:predicted AlkP superfamily phosphohydrolase/phosphomutase